MDVERVKFTRQAILQRSELLYAFLPPHALDRWEPSDPDQVVHESERLIGMFVKNYGRQQLGTMYRLTETISERCDIWKSTVKEDKNAQWVAMLVVLIGHEIRDEENVEIMVEPVRKQLLDVGLLDDPADIKELDKMIHQLLKAGTSFYEEVKTTTQSQSKIAQPTDGIPQAFKNAFK